MKKKHLLLLLLLLTGCKQQDILNNLSQQQANEVLAVLQRQNIYAEKKYEGKNGYTVSVEERDFAAAVDWLKIYDLPARPDINVSQMFPSDSLVSSPRAEKARLYSAIEQRLEQTLRSMDGIMSARVHVSYDVESGEGGKEPLPVHLAVLAIYDRSLDPQNKINEIKRFLINTFSGLEYENISVVLSRSSEVQQFAPTAIVQQYNWTQEKIISGFIFIALVISALITWLWFNGGTVGPALIKKFRKNENENENEKDK